jgi:glycerate kinase
MNATTYGLGEMMLDAIHRGVRHIILGIGGSATCDAGQGMLLALGLLKDGDGTLLPPLTVACDVDNPLYGKDGAAHVFAPQKGANPEQVKLLDERLKAFAISTEQQGIATPEDAFHPGAGAAGGLGYALLTYLRAELKPGIEVVMEASGFDEALKGADLVITGEGCSDEQTTHGKVAAGVLQQAKEKGVKTVLMSGQIKDKEALIALGFNCLYSINEHDERPLEVLIQPEVAKENIRKTCQRMMEDVR